MSTKPCRALVVIDVQNEYITGNFRIEYPPVESSLPNIAKAIEAARSADIPVFVVQHVLPEGAPIFAEGTVGAELHPVIYEKGFDYRVRKVLPSVFSANLFSNRLSDEYVDTIAIVGYMTHNCNDATAREAMHRGFDVEILSDACGSLPYANNSGFASAEDLHRTTLTVMESAYAAVMTTDEWIGRLQDPERAPRDNIFMSNQRALQLR